MIARRERGQISKWQIVEDRGGRLKWNDWGAPLKICRRLKRRLLREVQGGIPCSLAEGIVEGLACFETTRELVLFHALAAFVAPVAVFASKWTMIWNYIVRSSEWSDWPKAPPPGGAFDTHECWNATLGNRRLSNTRKLTLESGVRMLAVGFRFPARIIESLPLWTHKTGVGVMAVDFKFQWDSARSLHERKSWLRGGNSDTG